MNEHDVHDDENHLGERTAYRWYGTHQRTVSKPARQMDRQTGGTNETAK